MGLINKTGYSYNDLTIIPESRSTINSRLECNPFLKDTDSFLPIFTAPMASVVNNENLVDFLHNGIIPILPRNIDLEIRKEEMLIDDTWVALSLKEFNDLFINHANEREKHITYNICVDIANGHMEKLYSDCIVAKQKSIEYDYNLIIMTGNIANPKTYRWICDLNYSSKIRVIDYIRVGIGGGSGCFIDGTKIKTINGKKNIEDITVEDKVLTIDGSYKNVLSTIRYKTNNLIKINNEITSTPNHKYFVINKCNKDIINEKNLKEFGYWVEAQNLDKNKHLLIKLE